MKKYLFLLIALTSILCVRVCGQVGFPWPNDKLSLFGQADKTLTGIKQLHVFIVLDGNDPNKDAPIWKDLDAKVNSKLQQAGMKIDDLSYIANPVRAFNAPELRIEIDMLKLIDSEQYVFNIQTCLARTVHFRKKIRLKADVWQTKTVMAAASVEKMSTVITKIVTDQIDAFIADHKSANTKPIKPPKTEKAIPDTTKRILPIARQTTSTYQYLASKNSKVFHLDNCSSAKRIIAANIISYNNPDQAIQAGKRPCKICKP